MTTKALILLGPPGAGKGTQGRMLAARFGYPVVSTGDMLREAVQKQTEVGRKAQELMNAGELVPDSLVNEIVRARLAEGDMQQGFILDGYPRTVAQAEFFEQLADAGRIDTLAIGVMVDDEVLVGRLSARWNCPGCGRIYNAGLNPALREGHCGDCGGRLIQRSDDQPQVIRERLEVYHQITRPVIDFFRRRGIYVEVDGEGSADRVFSIIVEVVNGEEHKRTAAN